ncbi:MAG: hypothetical protein RLZZ293_588 [Pseudomonadota bacterium]|jgi:acyl-CoA thioester hydrolase
MFKEYFEVRDYELDFQGIVNNANYLSYLEHTRHKYLASVGISIMQMTQEQQMLHLARTELEYKYPLRAKDKFYVTCELSIEGIRIICKQEIYTLENKLILKSKNTIVCKDLLRNRLYIPPLIKQIALQDQ